MGVFSLLLNNEDYIKSIDAMFNTNREDVWYLSRSETFIYELLKNCWFAMRKYVFTMDYGKKLKFSSLTDSLSVGYSTCSCRLEFYHEGLNTQCYEIIKLDDFIEYYIQNHKIMCKDLEEILRTNICKHSEKTRYNGVDIPTILNSKDEKYITRYQKALCTSVILRKNDSTGNGTVVGRLAMNKYSTKVYLEINNTCFMFELSEYSVIDVQKSLEYDLVVVRFHFLAVILYVWIIGSEVVWVSNKTDITVAKIASFSRVTLLKSDELNVQKLHNMGVSEK